MAGELLKYHTNADEKIGCGLEAIKVIKPAFLQRRRSFSTTADERRSLELNGVVAVDFLLYFELLRRNVPAFFRTSFRGFFIFYQLSCFT